MDHRFTNFSGITTGGLASSSILDNSPKYYIGTISYYLHPVLTNLSSSKFIKCYHAQTDGWNSTTFHSKCNGKGPTISPIQVGNYTFRGYTNASWQGMHFQLVISSSLQRRWLGKQYPLFGAKICADSGPPTLSVPRCSQFPQSEARGKL